MRNTFRDSGAKEKFIQGIEDIPMVRIRVKGTLLLMRNTADRSCYYFRMELRSRNRLP